MEIDGFSIKMIFGTKHFYTAPVLESCKICQLTDCNECPVIVVLNEDALHISMDEQTPKIAGLHKDHKIRNLRFA